MSLVQRCIYIGCLGNRTVGIVVNFLILPYDSNVVAHQVLGTHDWAVIL